MRDQEFKTQIFKTPKQWESGLLYRLELLEDGGIEAFICREVLPYTPDAWIDKSATKIGYEISFTRHFYKPQPLRTLEEIRADIIALQKKTEGLLDEIVKGEAK